MTEETTKPNVSAPSGIKLKSSKPPKGQKYVAVTYALVQHPKDTRYGAYKVLCFGETIEDVDEHIGAMYVSGEIEKGLPFINIVPVGEWRYLQYGGEPTDKTVVMNTKDGKIESDVMREKAKKEAEAAREMQERFDAIENETRNGHKETPFEEYSRWRTQRTMAIQRERQLMEMVKQVKQARGNAIVNIKRIESQHGNFRRKFDKKYQVGPPSDPQEEKLLEEIPPEYTPPEPKVMLNPREFDPIQPKGKEEDDDDDEE